MASHLQPQGFSPAFGLLAVIRASGVLCALSRRDASLFPDFPASGVGLAIVLAASADGLGADKQIPARWALRLMWAAIVLFLMISPMLTVLAVGPISLSWDYLDVLRLEQDLPENVPVKPAWQQDFVKLMRLAQNPEARYYFLLDWPGALVGPRGFVLDYHLMHAYRSNGYYSKNIQDSQSFLCSHPDFAVLDGPNGAPSTPIIATTRTSKSPTGSTRISEWPRSLNGKSLQISTHPR